MYSNRTLPKVTVHYSDHRPASTRYDAPREGWLVFKVTGSCFNGSHAWHGTLGPRSSPEQNATLPSAYLGT